MTFLTDLGDVLRGAGLGVVEVGGWQTRARSGGKPYASGRPTHIMWHHTVSNTAPKNDANYICFGSSYPPIANLLFPRDGSVWVCAGGPTNTNGRGSDVWGGGVPDNAMNLYAIGCEISNEGTGEPYPQAQQEACLRAGVAMGERYGIPAGNHRAHFEWSPGRKIDPYGPSRWNDHRVDYWNMDRFRGDVWLASQTPPPLPPDLPPGADMIHPLSPYRNSDTRAYGGNGLPPNKDHEFTIDSAKVPANAVAVALGLAVVPTGGKAGFASVRPSGTPFQDTSTVNFEASGAHNGSLVVGVQDLKVLVRLSQQAHVILDVTGYWT